MCQKTDTCLIHPSSFFEEETSHVFQILIRQSTSGVPWICRMPQGSRRSWPWQRRPWICPGLPECGPFWRGWGKNRGQSVIAGIGLCFNGDMKNMATHTTRWMDRVLDECFFFRFENWLLDERIPTRYNIDGPTRSRGAKVPGVETLLLAFCY